MGGYGSSRWGYHRKAATVEASMGLPLRDVLRGGPGSRSVHWTRRERPAGSIGYALQDVDGEYRVWLHYSITPHDGEPKAYNYAVAVATVQTAAGIPQRLWSCPLVGCGRPVRWLYLPAGAEYFGCRHCFRLVYASAQGHDKRFDYLAALMRGDLIAARRFQPEYDRQMGKLKASRLR